jgi:hypothetical protein
VVLFLESMLNSNEAKWYNQSIGIDDYYDVTLSLTCVAIGPAPAFHDHLPTSSSRTGYSVSLHHIASSDHGAREVTGSSMIRRQGPTAT